MFVEFVQLYSSITSSTGGGGVSIGGSEATCANISSTNGFGNGGNGKLSTGGLSSIGGISSPPEPPSVIISVSIGPDW